MHTIDLAEYPYTYNKGAKTFTICEKLKGKILPFGTEYKLISPETRNEKVFTFSSQTGSEWDPNTKYIYKSDDITLEICQDKATTEARGKAYLEHKLKN